MTDYDIEVEVFYGSDGEPISVTVDTANKTYVYTVEELQGTNLIELIDEDKVTVYRQEDTMSRQEHFDIYGW